MKWKQTMMACLAGFAFCFGNVLTAPVAHAASDCSGLSKGGSTVIKVEEVQNCDGVKQIQDRIYGLAKVVAGIVLGFAVLMIVYAGFKYTTSQGDPKVTEQAKMQIIAAGIGIGIAMLAFVIVNVFQTLMG